MPHGSGVMAAGVPPGIPCMFPFTFRLPLRMWLILKYATSLPVSGTLKSRTAAEYLFHTVTWAMTPGAETLTIPTSVSVLGAGVGVPGGSEGFTQFIETFQYGTSSVAAGTLSYAQVTA